MRLTIVDRLLAGNSPDLVAREANIVSDTAKQWLASFERGGIAALISNPRRACVPA
jgi:transposase